MLSQIRKSLKRSIHRTIAYGVSFVLRTGSVYDPVNFNIWQKRGYHITPVHFYYPVPDTRELERTYPKPTSGSGIDFRIHSQLELLNNDFRKLQPEYNAIPSTKVAGEKGFYLDNDAFSGIDPLVYYSMIRTFQPKTIIEIGSGHSTLLAIRAATLNNPVTRLKVIDPWSRDFTQKFMADNNSVVEHIQKRVENIPVDYFLQLEENDILFIDSSHVVRTGGDVCHLILEVLPKLKKGVLVHFHDIYLPYEYPHELLFHEHRFWTEQYMLQAYLSENSHIEVVFTVNLMAQIQQAALKNTFPKALRWEGASFWVKKC